MNVSGPGRLSREAVAVFHTADALQEVIDDLLSHGFDRAQLSLLAGEAAVEDKLGHLYEKVQDEEDDPQVPRTAYVSPESFGDAKGGVVGTLMYVPAVAAAGMAVATGGALAAAFIAAALAAGSGGALGAVLAHLIGEHHARYLKAQLDKGGLLLWVRTPNDAAEKKAVDILARHAGDDVHVHGIGAPKG